MITTTLNIKKFLSSLHIERRLYFRNIDRDSMLKNNHELPDNKLLNGFGHDINNGVTRLTINDKSLKVLVVDPGNVTSISFNTSLSNAENKGISTHIDYSDSAIGLLCAVEEKKYDVIFIDYHLDNVDIFALLTFIKHQSPQAKVFVTSYPVWNTNIERDKFTSHCSRCCHESFYELNVQTFLESILKYKTVD